MNFKNAYFFQKGVQLRLYSCVDNWTLKSIHAQWANVWAVIMYLYTSIHALLEHRVAKAVTLHHGKSGRQFRPSLCNWPGVKSTSSFSSASPCNHPPSIFGAWAVSTHWHLPRTIRSLYHGALVYFEEASYRVQFIHVHKASRSIHVPQRFLSQMWFYSDTSQLNTSQLNHRLLHLYGLVPFTQFNVFPLAGPWK